MTAARVPRSSENKALLLQALEVIYDEWEMLSRDSGPVAIRLRRPDFAPMGMKLDSVLDRLVRDGLLSSCVYDEGSFDIICNDNFEKRYNAYLKKLSTGAEIKAQIQEVSVPELFKVKLNDREISVNGYSLAKPQWDGKNLELFEFLLERPNKTFRKEDFPNDLQKALGAKQLNMVVAELGFKDEIADTFFPGRTKSSIFFRNEVRATQLEEEGLDPSLLVKALDLAHSRRTRK